MVRLTRNGRTDCGCDERLLRRVVKTSFNQRRKMMRGSLKPLFAALNAERAGGSQPEGVADFLARPEMTKRPEQLSVEEFIELTNSIDRLYGGEA